ncbi:hypothetical protein FLA_2123 [Filimonas lacunae]|nr:hypothetical protein FLA_2123 [Filimonas lacunae]
MFAYPDGCSTEWDKDKDACGNTYISTNRHSLPVISTHHNCIKTSWHYANAITGYFAHKKLPAVVAGSFLFQKQKKFIPAFLHI